MSTAITDVITDLEKELTEALDNSDWHLKKFKSYEMTAVKIRETILGLKEVESKL